MQLTDTTMTLFASAIERSTGNVCYSAEVYHNVSWFEETVTGLDSDGGLKSASKITIRIPRTASAFPGRPGDLVAKGSWPTLDAAVGCTATILGVTDNRRASHAPHWKVVAT